MPGQQDPRQPSRLDTSNSYTDARYAGSANWLNSPKDTRPLFSHLHCDPAVPVRYRAAAHVAQAQPGQQQHPTGPPPEYTPGTDSVAQGAARRPSLRHTGRATTGLNAVYGGSAGPIADRSAQPTSSYTTSAANLQPSTITGGNSAENTAKKGLWNEQVTNPRTGPEGKRGRPLTRQRPGETASTGPCRTELLETGALPT